MVEAKKTIVDPRKGQKQAELYASCLEEMHGQRPLIYFTNGYTTWLWDDLMYPPREVAGFCKKDELDTLIRRREQRQPLDVATVEQEVSKFESDREKAVEIAALLEEKSAIPAVQKQLGYLRAMQEMEFWVGIDLAGLEEMRLRLRDLVPLLEKSKRHVVYTNFEDEITGVRKEAPISIPRMTGAEYQRKVEKYLQAHLNHTVIHRLRTNQPLSKGDLGELEAMLVKIGEADGEALLMGLLAQSKAPSLAHFVRQMVGMDRAAAQEAFSRLLSNQSLTAPQIRFVEMIIDQLTARGVMEPEALYEAPFTIFHAGGPEGLFAGNGDVITGIFRAIEATQPVLQTSAG